MNTTSSRRPSRASAGSGRRLNRYLAVLRRHLPLLRSQLHVRTLGVFGSHVRGTSRPDSDLDLLVEFTRPPSLFEFVALEQRLSSILGVKVDLVMKDTLMPFIGRQILDEVVGL